MRAIGHDGVYQSNLPDFMVFLDWKEYPWYWSMTDNFWYCMALVVLVPGVLAFTLRLLCLPFTHQRRVLLDHHASHDLCLHADVLS